MASSTINLPTKFLHSENIWKQVSRKSGLNGLNGIKLLGLGSSPTPSSIASFFESIMHCNKNDPHQIQFEKDLVMFIVKELVPLSFIEAPFLRRLILK